MRGKLYKTTKRTGQKVVNSRHTGEQFSQNSQVVKIWLGLHTGSSFSSTFFSKSPLVRSCIFEFGSGSSCLNRIEDNEAFDLQNY